MSSAAATPSPRALARPALVVAALGVVFGDIGTSPLYAFRVALGAAGGSDPASVFGVLSLVFWSLILVVSIKYVALILRVDNGGEGGILALAALLELHRRTGRRSKRLLAFVAMAGAALLFGDAVITPAISVLSAVEGVADIDPELRGATVPIATAILATLFVAQRFGVGRIGAVFGPVMLAWFALLALSGLPAIIDHPGVLVALSPHHGLALIIERPFVASAVLGAVFLAVTGGEALYADLGQFGRRAIARAWLLIALPALLINYFGQGAVILASGGSLDGSFYALFPGWLLPIIVALATAATVIASQAVLTGLASLGSQAVRLGFVPPTRILHQSPDNPHELYLPAVNLMAGVATIAVVWLYGSSDALADAYGIAVAGAMVTTTILYVTYRLKHARRARTGARRVLALAAGLLLLDAVFVLANADKILSGGALPIGLSALVMLIAIAWRTGKERMAELQSSGMANSTELLRRLGAKSPTCERPAVFLMRPGSYAPRACAQLLDLAGLKFRTSLLVTVWTASTPRVKPETRLSITQMSEGISRIDLRVGYMQTVNLPALLGETFAKLGIDADDVTYIVNLERPIAPPVSMSPRRLLLALYAILARLAWRGADKFSLPPTRVLEVGMPRRL